MKTRLTLGEQLMALKESEARKKKEADYKNKLITKYGSPIKPNSPDRNKGGEDEKSIHGI